MLVVLMQKTKMMKKLSSLFSLVLLCTQVNAQSKIQGYIVSEDKTPIQYANILLLQKSDSALISAVMGDAQGRFEVSSHADNIIKISSVGYKDSFFSVSSLPDTVVLYASPIALNEVVVKTPPLPITRMSGNSLITNIKGSVLEHVGNSKDVLGKLPGILVSNGSVQVFGKGAPAIYINGHLVRNDNLLDQLSSERIKDVELITNPGSRYDAEVSSVIRITTVKEQGDGFSLNNTAKVSYCDYVNASDILDINYRWKKVDVFATGEYDWNRQKGKSSNIQRSWTSRNIRQDIAMDARYKQQLYDGKIGFNYMVSDKHSLGAFYKVSHMPLDTKAKYDTQSAMDGILSETSFVDKTADSKPTEHLLEAYYKGAFGKWTLDANLNCLWRNGRSNEYSTESDEAAADRKITIHEDNAGRLYTGELHARHPLWKGSLSFGVEASGSQRTEDYCNVEAVIKDNADQNKEINLAAYVETSQQVGKVMFSLGLRYEHVNRKYYNKGVLDKDLSSSYNDVFPTASVAMPIGRTMWQLSYARKYNRPFYAQLSSTVSYVNKYLYQSGNPNLKSQYNDNLSFAFRYSWFMLMMNYTHTSGKIIDECLSSEDNPSVTVMRKVNSEKGLDQLQAMVSVNPHFGLYYPTLMGGVLSQFYEVEYKGGIKKFNQPLFIVRMNNMFMLKRNFQINVDLNWRSAGESENIHLNQNWALSAGVSKQIGCHWNLNLSAQDIFNTSKVNKFHIYSAACDVDMSKRVNSRTVMFTARYSFNTAKSKYAGKGVEAYERERLK